MPLFVQDFEKILKRRNTSWTRAMQRCGIGEGNAGRIRSGASTNITVNTLVKMLVYMNKTDIEKYILEE